MEIKAITTHYNGYKFRSRLEARWAVFFDAAGIEYEYEKEGFVLSNGELYLPDFWIPEWNVWVEIKPIRPNLLGTDISKPLSFCKELASVIVAGGDPWHTTTLLLARHGSGDVVEVAIGLNPLTDRAVPVQIRTDGARQSFIDLFRLSLAMNRITESFEKARSARFEHGEKG